MINYLIKKCERDLKELAEQKELTQVAKTKIKTVLDNNEQKIKDIKTQLSATAENITILKGKLVYLEKEKTVKEQEMKAKEEQLPLASTDEKIRLKAEIEKLQDERLEIIGKIEDINVQILNL
ncbi:DNA double-strand break repair protein Rad50, partial [Candidatus Phytoplasma citri]